MPRHEIGRYRPSPDATHHLEEPMTTETPAAVPVEAYPARIEFVVEVRESDRWLQTGHPFTGAERGEAEARLARRRELFPDWEHRLVERTTTYRVVSGGGS